MQTSYPEISSEERNLRTPYPKRIDALPFSSGGLIDGVSVQAFQGDNKCGLFSLKVYDSFNKIIDSGSLWSIMVLQDLVLPSCRP